MKLRTLKHLILFIICFTLLVYQNQCKSTKANTQISVIDKEDSIKIHPVAYNTDTLWKNTADSILNRANYVDESISKTTKSLEQIMKELEALRNFEPSFANCPTIYNTSESILKDLNNYSKEAKIWKDTASLLISALLEIDRQSLDFISTIDTSKLYSDAERYEIAKRQNEFEQNKNLIEQKSKEILNRFSIRIAHINEQTEIRSRQIEILSANLKFDLFRTNYNSFHFPPGEFLEKFLTTIDISSFERDMSELTGFFNKNRQRPELSKVKLKIVVLSFGHADLNSLSREKMNEIFPKDSVRLILSLPERDRDLKSNQMLSNYRAETVSTYVLNYLKQKNTMSKTDFEVCAYGFGIQVPDIDSKYASQKDDPERRVVRCYYHVIAVNE